MFTTAINKTIMGPNKSVSPVIGLHSRDMKQKIHYNGGPWPNIPAILLLCALLALGQTAD